METASKECRAHIEQLAARFNTSRMARFLMWCECKRRHYRNTPFAFMWVEHEGVPVGPPLEVHHLTLHDMMEHQAAGRLTDEILLRGLRANAIQRVSFERTGDYWGKTTIQPRWV